MAKISFQMPKISDLNALNSFIRDFNKEVDPSRIEGIKLGVDGHDEGVNLIIIESSQLERELPTARAFPISLTRDELALELVNVENTDNFILRSFADALIGSKKHWIALFDPIVDEAVGNSANGTLTFNRTKVRVHNRGVPPDSFLEELVIWGREADDEIFVEKITQEPEIYAFVKDELGPYLDQPHRRACMLEVMRVLAGFESSWDWTEGVDITNPTSNTPLTREAGAFQVSANSQKFGQDLKDLLMKEVGTLDGTAFQKAMKENHSLAMEYIARLLRHTCRHNGPVKRKEINQWLSKAAVEEFQSLLMT